jgi:hypothetical protein
MDAKRGAVAAVWVGTLAAGVLIAVTVPGPFVYAALALATAVALVAGMIVQLMVGEQAGFVSRFIASATGSFGVLLLVALVRLLVGG